MLRVKRTQVGTLAAGVPAAPSGLKPEVIKLDHTKAGIVLLPRWSANQVLNSRGATSRY